ncbi:phage virion morphogenesis protein [Nitratidesulfovibrio vulgaris]|uniref:phage virion morphogenesis protein n=1 Tax=Nitratidesulfovibrio vulgaris TaxID=881 RepID=UPI0013E043AF|nr:phage virion morphogenesis protein [Nitratidesulfovibrio vulgaris]
MIEIEVNTEAIEEGLQRLAALGRDLTPVARALGGVMADAAERAFAGQCDPVTGAAWHPLSPVTLARRAKGGHDGPILQVRGILASSIHTDYGRDHVTVGTNEPHARTHQFGAMRGAHGRTRRGGPIPWGNIPARPFLGVGPEDEEEMLGVLREATRRALAGA